MTTDDTAVRLTGGEEFTIDPDSDWDELILTIPTAEGTQTRFLYEVFTKTARQREQETDIPPIDIERPSLLESFQSALRTDDTPDEDAPSSDEYLHIPRERLEADIAVIEEARETELSEDALADVTDLQSAVEQAANEDDAAFQEKRQDVMDALPSVFLEANLADQELHRLVRLQDALSDDHIEYRETETE